MRKLMAVIGVCILAAGVAVGDVYTLSFTVTNNQTAAYSDPLPISGFLEKVEFVQTGGDALSTSSVMLATFSGTTAVDIYVTNTTAQTTRKVTRPRILGTGTTGTTLVKVTEDAGQASTNECATTILTAPYERPSVGSNLKLKYWGNDVVNTLTNTVRIFTVKDK